MQGKDKFSEEIKEKLEAYPELQFNEEHWAELEARLDEEDEDKVIPLFVILGRIAAAVLLLVAAAWTINNFRTADSAPVVVEEKLLPSSEDINTATDETQPNDTENNTETFTADSINNNINRGNDETIQERNNNIVRQRLYTSSNGFSDEIPSQNNVINQYPRFTKKPFNNDESQDRNINMMADNDVVDQEEFTPVLPLLPVQDNEAAPGNPVDIIVEEDPNPRNVEDLDNNASEVQEIGEEKEGQEELEDKKKDIIDLKKKKQRKSSPIRVALALTPMSTDETLTAAGSAGFAAGINVSKNLGSKTTVTSGLNYSRQNHITAGDSYNNVDDYWLNHTQNIVPLSVDAKNQVLEMPVQITRTLGKKEDKGVFLGLGVNNTMTFNEKHNFEFDQVPVYGGYIGRDDWEVKPNNLSLLNSGQTIIGYKTTIKKKVGIEVSSILDVPLKENGWGDLQLANKGLRISFSKASKASE